MEGYLKIGSDIGKSFIKARLDKQMTRAELAEKSGLHVNTIGLLERNEMNGSIYVYLSIAKALGYDGIVFEVNRNDAHN